MIAHAYPSTQLTNGQNVNYIDDMSDPAATATAAAAASAAAKATPDAVEALIWETRRLFRDAAAAADYAVASLGISAGDRALLVEYGDMEFDLALNFFVLAVDEALRHERPAGLIETAPGFRSILVMHDPFALPAERSPADFTRRRPGGRGDLRMH